MEIRWTDIEAECGSYRDGFVAVFRKYEGQLTDEKDAQGRTVKVTTNSFARHAGIPETTFKRWVKRAVLGPLPRRPTPAERLDEDIRNLSPERKGEFASEILGEVREELEDASDDREWTEAELALAAQNLIDPNLPDEFKDQLRAGVTDPVAFTGQGEPGYIPDTVRRIAKEPTEYDGIVQWGKARKAMQGLIGYSTNDVLQVADHLQLKHLEDDLPIFIDYLTKLRIAVNKRMTGVHVVDGGAS